MMKQLIAVLLCLLLCGCSREPVFSEQESIPETTDSLVCAGLYQPGHPMEQQYPDLIRAYPLPMEAVQEIRVLKNDLLVLSGQEHTTITLFRGEELQKTACITLDFSLEEKDASWQVHENGISFFDPVHLETVLLDQQLQEIRRIAAPSGLSGKPILSADTNTLYYCTGWAVMAWDLQSGVRRTVKEMAYDRQELTALHLEDQILECRIQNGSNRSRLLLSSDQGIEMETLPESGQLYTGNSRYFASLEDGYQTLLLFGQTDSEPQLLLPDHIWDQQFYLPEDHAAVTISPSEAGIRLDYYELNTGILRSSLTLEAPVKDIVNSKSHGVYILAYDPAAQTDILYRWDVLGQPPEPTNVTSFRTPYYRPEDPDRQALETCREYADIIAKKYGITVRIWEEAVSVEPWDYHFRAEHLAPVLTRELTLLDQRLAQYPESLLQQTIEHFSGLTICLVRQITGAGDSGSLRSATGIQFFRDKEAYVVITTGRYSEQALYHELYHVMETHILTKSTALDQWESLNPAAFSYGAETPQDAQIYLKGQTRAFVDRYSMQSPKEDRARILENAILAGKKDLFQSEYMQRKLTAVCTGIREAYKLKKHPEPLPWEQYLINTLIPNP